MIDVVPDHISIQIFSSCEENSPAGTFRQAVSELHILVRLRPARQQEDIDRDAFAFAKQTFPLGGLFSLRIRWIQHVKQASFEVRRGKPVCDQNHLPVRGVLNRQHLPSKLKAVLNVRKVRRNMNLGDIVTTHVRPQSDHRTGDSRDLGHQGNQISGCDDLRERVHVDKLQEVARKL